MLALRTRTPRRPPRCPPSGRAPDTSSRAPAAARRRAVRVDRRLDAAVPVPARRESPCSSVAGWYAVAPVTWRMNGSSRADISSRGTVCAIRGRRKPYRRERDSRAARKIAEGSRDPLGGRGAWWRSRYRGNQQYSLLDQSANDRTSWAIIGRKDCDRETAPQGVDGHPERGEIYDYYLGGKTTSPPTGRSANGASVAPETHEVGPDRGGSSSPGPCGTWSARWDPSDHRHRLRPAHPGERARDRPRDRPGRPRGLRRRRRGRLRSRPRDPRRARRESIMVQRRTARAGRPSSRRPDPRA